MSYGPQKQEGVIVSIIVVVVVPRGCGCMSNIMEFGRILQTIDNPHIYLSLCNFIKSAEEQLLLSFFLINILVPKNNKVKVCI